jgi:ketosteroid isomerase-like protein
MSASAKDFTREAFHNYVENKRPASDLTTQIRKLAETFAYPLLSGRDGQWTAEELEPVLREFVATVCAEAKAEQHAADVKMLRNNMHLFLPIHEGMDVARRIADFLERRGPR